MQQPCNILQPSLFSERVGHMAAAPPLRYCIFTRNAYNNPVMIPTNSQQFHVPGSRIDGSLSFQTRWSPLAAVVVD